MDALVGRVLARKLRLIMSTVDSGKQALALAAMQRKMRCCQFLMVLRGVLERYHIHIIMIRYVSLHRIKRNKAIASAREAQLKAEREALAVADAKALADEAREKLAAEEEVRRIQEETKLRQEEVERRKQEDHDKQKREENMKQAAAELHATVAAVEVAELARREVEEATEEKIEKLHKATAELVEVERLVAIADEARLRAEREVADLKVMEEESQKRLAVEAVEQRKNLSAEMAAEAESMRRKMKQQLSVEAEKEKKRLEELMIVELDESRRILAAKVATQEAELKKRHCSAPKIQAVIRGKAARIKINSELNSKFMLLNELLSATFVILWKAERIDHCCTLFSAFRKLRTQSQVAYQYDEELRKAFAFGDGKSKNRQQNMLYLWRNQVSRKPDSRPTQRSRFKGVDAVWKFREAERYAKQLCSSINNDETQAYQFFDPKLTLHMDEVYKNIVLHNTMKARWRNIFIMSSMYQRDIEEKRKNRLLPTDAASGDDAEDDFLHAFSIIRGSDLRVKEQESSHRITNMKPEFDTTSSSSGRPTHETLSYRYDDQRIVQRQESLRRMTPQEARRMRKSALLSPPLTLATQ